MTLVTDAVTGAAAAPVTPAREASTIGPGLALHIGLDASAGAAGSALMVELAQAIISLVAERAPGATTTAALALGEGGPQREIVARFGADLAAQVPGPRRRHLRVMAPVTAGTDAPAAELPRVVVDSEAHEVTLDGTPVPMAKKELALLEYLLRAPHRAVSRSELLRTVWEDGASAGTRTIDVHVRRLREKLGGCPQIVTVRGVGYRCDPSPEVVLVGSGDAG